MTSTRAILRGDNEWAGHSHCETALKEIFHGKVQDPGIVGLSDLTKGPARGLKVDWANHGVKIVHSDELDLNTAQTSGMTRAAATTHARVGANKLWAGTMLVQPDAKTGPHHHGELETVLYVVRAECACAGAINWNSARKPGRVTLSMFRLTCRTRRSMPAQIKVAKLSL